MDDSNNVEQTTEQTEVKETAESKESTKTFSQSENDKLVAEAIRKDREKLDVNSIMSKLEKLEKENSQYREREKEREEANMTELQKVQAQRDEIAKAKEQLEAENFNFKKSTKINEVLADAKYKELPKVYRNLVTYSDNFDEIVNSADSALNQYKEDFGGQVKSSFGIPDTSKADQTNGLKLNTSDGKNAVKAHIMERLKNRM
jgi:hypothetical protein